MVTLTYLDALATALSLKPLLIIEFIVKTIFKSKKLNYEITVKIFVYF